MSTSEMPERQRRNWRVLSYAAALLAPAAVLLLVWPKLVTNLFASGFGDQMFMPHGMCYLWVPQLYLMHVSSDLLIGISYVAISSTLIYLIYRARGGCNWRQPNTAWLNELAGAGDRRTSWPRYSPYLAYFKSPSP
jgi:hypothetical protein